MCDSEWSWGISSEDLWIVRLESARTAPPSRWESASYFVKGAERLFWRRPWQNREDQKGLQGRTPNCSRFESLIKFILLKKQLQARASHFERSGFWFLRFFFIVFVCLLVAFQEDIEGSSRRSGKLRSKTEGALAANLIYRFYMILQILQCKDPSVILMWCITLHHLGIASLPAQLQKPCLQRRSLFSEQSWTGICRAKVPGTWGANDCIMQSQCFCDCEWTAMDCAKLCAAHSAGKAWLGVSCCGVFLREQMEQWERLAATGAFRISFHCRFHGAVLTSSCSAGSYKNTLSSSHG